MKLSSFDALVTALAESGVRYLIAGGLAVNAHGYLRFTKDVDVVVQLAPDNVEHAFAALATLGYRPLVPVAAAQFADTSTREKWVRFVTIPTLIRMKQAANRPQDRIDIEYLRAGGDAANLGALVFSGRCARTSCSSWLTTSATADLAQPS